MSYTKTILRTIFYQFLLLFVGLSLGFIANAEWVGFKSVLLERSLNNIFFQVEFTEDLEERVKSMGATRAWAELNYPSEFEILGDVVYYNDEFYWCKYKYRNAAKELVFGEYTTRIRWKTWEYNYGSPDEVIDTTEKANKVMDRLNAWHLKIKNSIKQADDREKEILELERQKKIKEST